MISIFQKKNYLADHLDGFTDFHNHLLPGIDDGAGSLDDTLAMISKFGEFGVKNFVASPHVMGEYYPNTPATINEALQKVRNALPENVKITAAAEYMMDHKFLELLLGEELLVLSGKKVLVEMSYFQAPLNLTDILFQLQNKSFKPVLAHPERYPFYHSNTMEAYENLKSRGCSFQLNMLSLTEHYGKGIQKAAFQLLKHGLIDYISSDAHRLQHLEKIANIKLSKKQFELLKPVIERSKDLFTSS